MMSGKQKKKPQSGRLESKKNTKIIKDNWSLSIGFYPGILFGIRTYEESTQTVYVLYIPFVDVALEIYH